MIHLLQHHTPNFKPLIDITRPLHEAYCNKHGYNLNIQAVPEYEVYDGEYKLKQILEFCEEGDIALVIDADAMITNMDITIESFLEDGKDLFLSEGLNMGVFIVRKTKWLTNFIEWVLVGIYIKMYHCEQDAIMDMKDDFLKQGTTKILPHPCFNSYPSIYYPEVPQPVSKEQGNWETGCYVIHTPALSLEKRCEILNQVKEQIVYE